jgi:3-hydroxyacyl-[acyl-carrier-protein] dehydratase
MELKEIQNVLLHRFPFLMVDRIVEMDYEKSSVGIKNVSINEPWVQGHFSEEPVFPGVLIIEAMAQIGGFAFYDSHKGRVKGYLCGVNKVKLIKKVVPGDTLWIEAKVKEKVGNLAQVQCVAKVQGETVAFGVISYAFKFL